MRISRDLWRWPWPWAHPGCMLTWWPSCASLVAIQPFACEKKRLLSLQTDRRTDDGRRAIALAHSWNELKSWHEWRSWRKILLYESGSLSDDISKVIRMATEEIDSLRTSSGVSGDIFDCRNPMRRRDDNADCWRSSRTTLQDEIHRTYLIHIYTTCFRTRLYYNHVTTINLNLWFNRF